ncbi:MAG: hypothetical protein CSYNP_00518 [Syntrophus sp. SKADARSKE-3]|nr:hypothetical protein [Syntrophus sp. SKADARSKE-3]
MKSSTKLIELTETHAGEIAQQWYNNIKNNPKTPFYHKIPEEKAKQQALNFYSRFGKLFLSEQPFDDAHTLFAKYAEDCYKEHIPLPQVIYAITLMRRHMWLYAEYQSTFTTAVDHHHAAESLNRTILMFDYATYVIVLQYDEMLRKEIEEKIKALKLKSPLAVSLWTDARK